MSGNGQNYRHLIFRLQADSSSPSGRSTRGPGSSLHPGGRTVWSLDQELGQGVNFLKGVGQGREQGVPMQGGGRPGPAEKPQSEGTPPRPGNLKPPPRAEEWGWLPPPPAAGRRAGGKAAAQILTQSGRHPGAVSPNTRGPLVATGCWCGRIVRPGGSSRTPRWEGWAGAAGGLGGSPAPAPPPSLPPVQSCGEEGSVPQEGREH